MLPLPPAYVTGHEVTHAELRSLHATMRDAVRAATKLLALDGPRLLDPARGEKWKIRAHGRDREGNLLASVTVYMPWAGAPYVRRVRLVRVR